MSAQVPGLRYRTQFEIVFARNKFVRLPAKASLT